MTLRNVAFATKTTEADMLEIYVYYNGSLRYAILGKPEKVRELREQGFYVEYQPARSTPRLHPAIESKPA
jgi:hypothetical protein